MNREDDRPVYGSGNIYADMGVPNPDLAQAKALLALEIDQVIRDRKLTQTQAAVVMGIKQPRVSKIVRGRLSEIGIEALMEYLRKLGSTVELTITSHVESSDGGSRSQSFVYGEAASTQGALRSVAEQPTTYDAREDAVAN